jgi:2-C-methyl-D-erythritol 4-phosphate cytidylyltransferase
VHDAVRPCLASTDLDRLIDSVLAAGCGGLLAVPVRDTMKRVDGARVTSTVPRDGLWHALTPQMFPIVALRDALVAARVDGANSTDEAEAMERQGYQPLVVEGRADNIKITRPDDLEHAALFLRHFSSPGIELQGPVPG